MTDSPMRVSWRYRSKTKGPHLTADGVTTLCGRPVGSVLIEPAGQLCLNCARVADAGAPDARPMTEQLEGRFAQMQKYGGREQVYTEDELTGALRWFAEEANGGLAPTINEYREMASDLGLPSAAIIRDRFVFWSAATLAAGLEPRGGSKPGHAAHFTRDDAVAALRACAAAVGRLPTYHAYEDWQRAQRPASIKGARGPRPSAPTVRKLAGDGGTWADALAAVFTG